jgi:hypothetical protein
MAIVVLQLIENNQQNNDTPFCCSFCGSSDIQSWGQASRDIYDTKPVNVVIRRYYCNYCHSTFRYYPRGIDKSKYSERVRRLAALFWLMGLSVRNVIEVFSELGVSLDRMAVWREGQKLTNELNSLKALNPDLRLSIDKSGDLLNRSCGNVLLVVGLENEKTAILGSLNSCDPIAVISWLEPILNEMNIGIHRIETREFYSR